MKNIHLLPTDKPSRLYLHSNNELQIRSNIIRTSEEYLGSNQHIYITSDEEIKEGDWVVKISSLYKGGGNIQKYSFIDAQFEDITFKKIILTTDQDLIKDGVQAISDEFIELFVKNLNCERVDINRDWGYPKIIIPQEEHKQETLEETAEKYAELSYYNRDDVNAFVNGAKWQAERMYSEEEVLELLHKRMIYTLGNDYQEITTTKWFEQFKKK